MALAGSPSRPRGRRLRLARSKIRPRTGWGTAHCGDDEREGLHPRRTSPTCVKARKGWQVAAVENGPGRRSGLATAGAVENRPIPRDGLRGDHVSHYWSGEHIRSGALLYSLEKQVTVAPQGDQEVQTLPGGHDMELRIGSSKKQPSRPVNECAQCRETIFLPEWTEYLDAHRVRHLWECESCGYKFETLVCFPA